MSSSARVPASPVLSAPGPPGSARCRLSCGGYSRLRTCLSSHLWLPSPGSVPSGPFSAGVMRGLSTFCVPPHPSSPHLSLSALSRGGFQVCPGSRLVVTPASTWPADCWAGAVGFVMHMFKSLERLKGKCSESHILLSLSVTWMNLRICPHLLFMTLSVSSDRLPCPSQ